MVPKIYDTWCLSVTPVILNINHIPEIPDILDIPAIPKFQTFQISHSTTSQNLGVLAQKLDKL